MEQIVRTFSGTNLQTVLLERLPFDMKPNTTLNEKFGIQPGIAPGPGIYPAEQYWTIGNGGHYCIKTASNIDLTKNYQHIATEGGLFNHLPFVLREVGNDLNIQERAKYALRREEIHNNARFYAYYLKRMDLSATVANQTLKKVNADGTSSTSVYAPDGSNLNPTPLELNPNGVNTVEGIYAIVSAYTNLSLSPAEVTEVCNAANIIHGDPAYAFVSEIGLVSGVDRIVSVASGPSATVNFNEVIAAQITSFIACQYPLNSSSSGMGLALDLGASDPLFKLGSK